MMKANAILAVCNAIVLYTMYAAGLVVFTKLTIGAVAFAFVTVFIFVTAPMVSAVLLVTRATYRS